MGKYKFLNKLKEVTAITITTLFFSSSAYAYTLPPFPQQNDSSSQDTGNYSGQALSPDGVGMMFTKFKEKISSTIDKLSQKDTFSGKSFYIEYDEPQFPNLWPRKEPASYVNAPKPLAICMLSMPRNNYVFKVGETSPHFGFYPEYPDEVENGSATLRPDMRYQPSVPGNTLTTSEWRIVYLRTMYAAKNTQFYNIDNTNKIKDIKDMEKCVSDQTKVIWLLDKEKQLFGEEGKKVLEMALLSKGYTIAHDKQNSNFTLKVNSDNSVTVLDKNGNTVFMN